MQKKKLDQFALKFDIQHHNTIQFAFGPSWELDNAINLIN